MQKETKKIVSRLIISLLIIGLVILGGYFLLKALGFLDMTVEEVRDLVSSTGVIAPLVFVFISFLQVTFVPIPSAITIVAGNYLFGPWLAFLYSYIGIFIGSVFAFVLGRKIGRPFVNWIAGSSEKVDEWIGKLKGRENVLLFFMFLLPFFPDDILCAIAGAISVRWSTFMIMQIFTRATSILGTLFFMSGEIIPFHGWGIAVLAVVAVVFIVAFVLSLIYSEKINEFFGKVIDKIAGKNKKENENQ